MRNINLTIYGGSGNFAVGDLTKIELYSLDGVFLQEINKTSATSDAHNNSSSTTFDGILVKSPAVSILTINNCKFKK